MSTDLRAKILKCESLPSLPAAALDVLRLTESSKTEIAELSEIISKDPALSVKVLRAVNSAAYGLSQKISSVPQAVALLGAAAVKTLVLGFSLVNEFRADRGGGFDRLRYWRRTMYSAAAARVLAKRFIPEQTEEAFIAALLMDIGMLVFGEAMGDQYGQLVEKAATHQDLLMLESHVLGLSHPEAGAILAAHWHLPAPLVTAIASHHGPQDVKEPAIRRVAQIIWLAGRCGDVFIDPVHAAEAISHVRKVLRESFKVDDVACDLLLCAIGQATSDMAGLFEVRLNGSPSYDQVLAQASQRLLEMQLAEKQQTEQAENRRTARVRRNGFIQVIRCERGALGAVSRMKLRDLSASGIGITNDEPLEIGQQFIIQLPQPDRSVKSLLYTVRRSAQTAGVWNIGAELTSVLRPEAVASRVA